MKTLIILATVSFASLSLTSTAWAEYDKNSKYEGRHHFQNIFFQKMDTNEDGAISKQEHEAGLEKMLEKRRATFDLMDKNKDGMVTKEESKDFHQSMKDKRSKEKRGS